jgi:hypothetical protein
MDLSLIDDLTDHPSIQDQNYDLKIWNCEWRTELRHERYAGPPTPNDESKLVI